MADMYGAVRSNEFEVIDRSAFVEWFNNHVHFGHSIELWVVCDDDDGVTVAFGGYEQYPSAWPCQVLDADDPEVDDPNEAWDLDEFAAELRKHLAPGEEFRVLAAGHEKLRYVAVTHLVITHTEVKYESLYEGN